MFKICTICKNEKPFAEFGKNSRIKDGYHYTCKECKKVQTKNYKINNKDKIKLSSAIYYLENKDRISARNKNWKIKNPDKLKEEYKKYYEQTREEQLKKGKIYRQNNRVKLNAKAAKERAARNRATPIWLTDLDKMQIEWYYAAAKVMTETSGIEHHVDHIHPIKGDNFTGLHVPWNLRCIPAVDNVSKGNKLIEEL